MADERRPGRRTGSSKQPGDVISSIRDRERERIARELHDSVLQSLTALKIRLENIRTTTDGTLSDELSKSIAHLQSDMMEIRAIVESGIPHYLDDIPIDQVLGSAIDLFRASHPMLTVDISRSVPSEILDKESTWTLYRILQESLSNAAKHSSATRIGVSLRARNSGYELRIADNGGGLKVDDRMGHYGLRNMRWRAAEVGGSVLLDSKNGIGTTVIVRVPMYPHGPSDGSFRGSTGASLNVRTSNED